MKQFIQYFEKHKKQKLRQYLCIFMLCTICCTAFSACGKKEPEVSILLNSESEAAGKDSAGSSGTELSGSEISGTESTEETGLLGAADLSAANASEVEDADAEGNSKIRVNGNGKPQKSGDENSDDENSDDENSDEENSGDKNSDEKNSDDEASGIYVYVCGCVRHPGVYQLSADARITDAVEAAGGLTSDAAEDYWNMADPLSDGDMICFPTRDEAAEREEAQGSARDTSLKLAAESAFRSSENQTASASGSSTSGSAAGQNSSGTAGNTAAAASNGSVLAASDGSTLVNINTADTTELMTLPGIGESRAATIIAYRSEHGSFASVSDIKNVSGIGDALFENMKNKITVQ